MISSSESPSDRVCRGCEPLHPRSTATRAASNLGPAHSETKSAMRRRRNRPRPTGRSCRGTTSLLGVFPRLARKRLHLGFIAGNPPSQLRLRDIAHRNGSGGLQKEAALSFFDNHQGIVDVFKAKFPPKRRRQGETAPLVDRQCRRHAATLHCGIADFNLGGGVSMGMAIPHDGLVIGESPRTVPGGGRRPAD
ncbi:MAG: hypothetical protein RLZZ34_1917 [Verrucomicrobiota bacterium]